LPQKIQCPVELWEVVLTLKILNKKTKIIYITGTRAEYGVMQEVLHAINNHPDLDLSLAVTGMHLSHTYGKSIKEIKKDGFKIGAIVNSHIDKTDNCAMTQSLGYCLIGMAGAFKKIEPDLVLVVGDRGEMLAAAVAAAHMNIPVVHVSGGDISGSIDNSIRKAITDFSHIHLVNTEEALKVLIKKGEERWRIKNVGSLGLNQKNFNLEKPEKIAQKFNLDIKKPIILVLQHPVTGESKDAGKQMLETLKAATMLGHQVLLIYPNADAGSGEMLKIIRQYLKKHKIKDFKTLSRRDFLGLMSIANIMIGNSSSGLMETPLFKLPAINVGTRQKGRYEPSNVVDAGYDSREIYSKAKSILNKKYALKRVQTIYRDDDTANKIVKELINIKISARLLNKYGK
jgi:GDP/UDP-N,N'-diacetylbacillosamine 2-epimerase (hydrolysing)